MQDCIDTRVLMEYNDGDYPQHCCPRWVVTAPWSSVKWLVVDYGERTKKTLNHSRPIPNMESTVEKTASYRYNTNMDNGSGFWNVDLTPNAEVLVSFIPH